MLRRSRSRYPIFPAIPPKVVEHPCVRIRIGDAVGAGDAFTAALTHHYLRGASLEKISQAANLLGAWVAFRVGATPAMEQSVLEQIK